MKRAPAKPIKLTAEQILHIEAAVFSAVEPLLPENFFLLDVTLEKEAGYWYLRVYVEEKNQGISLSECETISRTIDPVIDELPELQDFPFSLEVSSPGLFRPLRRQREFDFFRGKPVRVEDRPPATKGKKAVIPNKTKAIEGILETYSSNNNVLTLKNPQTQEKLEIVLDDTKIVCLNPIIHFPEEDESDAGLDASLDESTNSQADLHHLHN